MGSSIVSAFFLVLALLGVVGRTTALPLDRSAIVKRVVTDDSHVEFQQKNQRQNDYRPAPRSNDASASATTLKELYADLMVASIEAKNEAALANGNADDGHGVQVREPSMDEEHSVIQNRATSQRRSSVNALHRRAPSPGMTLNEQYAAMIQAAMEENDMLELDPDNASNDLIESVRRYRAELQETVK